MRCFALIPLLAFAACATHVPRAPLGAFMAGNLDPVRAHYEALLEDGYPESEALLLNGLGQIEMLDGNLDAAWRHFRTAGTVMNSWFTPGGETFAAVVGEEATKVWKGDPYEKAMNAYYLGLLYLFRGAPDDARACFKTALLADTETNDEVFRGDMALIHWLAGRMSLEMGLPNDAARYFESARSAREFAGEHGARGPRRPKVLVDPAAGNVVFLVDVGLGPEKIAVGNYGEMAGFLERRERAVRARVLLDDELLGKTETLLDVDYQARTRGGTEMEGIREGKALLKGTTQVSGQILLAKGLGRGGREGDTMAIIGGGLLLFSLFVRPEADIRHWEILPSTVQALAVDLPPGDHVVRVEFLDRGNRVVPSLNQTWTVTAPDEPGRSSYYVFRALPGLHRRGAVTP